MSVLIDKSTRLMVQGITGSEGAFHTKQMIEYGTKVVAGVTPGKGGTLFENKVPVFNSCREAVKSSKANASVIFVPPAFAKDAIIEAADSGVKLIVCITEGIPAQDMVTVKSYILKLNANGNPVRLIGPNCPGLISPGKSKIGIMPAFIHKPGRVGLVSRSGTLTYEAVDQLTKLGLGQSTCIGMGGDPVNGTSFLDAIKLFNEDPETDAIVMIGEIGGTAEEDAAAYIKKNVNKPVVGFIAGRTAPPGRRMGHAGAIIAGGKGTAAEKIEAMKKAGIHVAESPAEIGSTLKNVLDKLSAAMNKKVPVKKTSVKKVSVKLSAEKKPSKKPVKSLTRSLKKKINKKK
jgi:succinyl-CoA synthetase alpha subunit